MPEKKTIEKAKKALREGKQPSTAASEFVREEIEHVREGKHGARSPEQAIAIGLSKARRAGVPLPPPEEGQAPERTRRSARRDYETGQGKRKARAPSKRRAKATTRALEREGRAAVSKQALSSQAKRAAKQHKRRTTRKQPKRKATNQRKRRATTKSTRRRSSPFRSAMSMLSFYENRAGRSLSRSKRRAIRKAKDELRKLFGRPA